MVVAPGLGLATPAERKRFLPCVVRVTPVPWATDKAASGGLTRAPLAEEAVNWAPETVALELAVVPAKHCGRDKREAEAVGEARRGVALVASEPGVGGLARHKGDVAARGDRNRRARAGGRVLEEDGRSIHAAFRARNREGRT